MNSEELIISAIKAFAPIYKMIITNSYFTKNAKELAKKLNVKLIDKYELSKIIIKSQ